MSWAVDFAKRIMHQMCHRPTHTLHHLDFDGHFGKFTCVLDIHFLFRQMTNHMITLCGIIRNFDKKKNKSLVLRLQCTRSIVVAFYESIDFVQFNSLQV